MAKRKLSAAPVPEAAPETKSANMGGMWGGTALNMLRQRLAETVGGIAQGVATGVIVVDVPVDQIEDPVGSDRGAGWEGDPEIEALAENIARRGQRQAVRLRPLDEGWQPDPEDPMTMKGRFAVQSGRRRIEAARRLGQPVKAVISTDIGDVRLADLEERFHENTMRKSLTGFEELLSIGLIAGSLPDLSQEEIARRLSVSQNDVSLGRSCVEMHDRIVAAVDVATTPKRAYREIIPKLRRKSAPTFRHKAEEKAAPAVEVAETSDGIEVTARRRGRKVVLEISGAEVTDLARLARDATKFVRGR